MSQPFANPVGFLQEFCQKYNAAKFPTYSIVSSSGPDHCKQFSYKCNFEGLEVIVQSRQKKQAKVESASAMLELLIKNNYFEKFNISIANKQIMINNKTSTMDVTNCETVIKKNPISALQEYCQTKKINLPIYSDSSSPESGFVCSCAVDDETTHGYGPNKKSAKTRAAAKMCEKLNLSFGNEDGFESEEELVKKNSISALQELCTANNRELPQPTYTEKMSLGDLFIIVCTVGSVSAEGSDTTKKGAKVLAANKVLTKLKVSYNIPVIESSSRNRILMSSQGTQPPSNSVMLEEFNLDSGDESDLVNNDTEAASNLPIDPSSFNIKPELESLNLDDSLIDVEPSSVQSIKRDLESLILEDDNATNISENDNEGLQGPKVTLTDVLDQPSEQPPIHPFTLQVSDLEDKKSNKSKSAISERVAKWAQNTTT